MGYSKESERQNEVLKDLLAGKEHKKSYVQVGYEGKPKLKGDVKSELTDIMATARMPWFCPSCKKTMKKRLDNKFWRIQGVCFDCVLEKENKLRIDGKYESYEKRKVLQNRLSWVNDMIQGIQEWKKQGDVTFLNQNRPDGYSVDEETWSQNPDQVKALSDEAMVEMNKIKSEIEIELSKYI